MADMASRPNPMELHTVIEKPPAPGSKQWEQSSKEHFMRLLHDNNTITPTNQLSKQIRSGESNALALPKPPAVKQHGAKRLRIPPTLSGLHQPPPDAGLLPSMSVDQPPEIIENPVSEQLPSRPRAEASEREFVFNLTDGLTASSAKSRVKQSRKHRKWTERETKDLIKGVSKFGIGSWTKILNYPEFRFERRTALDLKDRFRVCFPDEYREGRSAKRSDPSSVADASKTSRADRSKPDKTGEDNTATPMNSTTGPFAHSKRRRRTEWTDPEDAALMAGFQKHGNSWASIRKDNSVLAARKATDLRDRFRTRWPEEYANAGMAPRLEHSSHKGKENGNVNLEAGKDNAAGPSLSKVDDGPNAKQSHPPPASAPKRVVPTSVIPADDAFWGAPFETEGEPITLDRGILDWALGESAAIDPRATFNMPPAPASNSVAGNGVFLVPPSSHNPGAALGNQLPSVATITSVASVDDFMETLELPSLAGGLGSLETDGRSGGQTMSLEDLLS